jgi:aspartate 1-decarboxylase
MQLTVLKAKLHQACVTHAELHYEGSCAIDGVLLDTAGIHEYEQIQIYNITNGERFTTYAIRAEEGSRIISINGAAAHKGSPGDRIIICSYGAIDAQEMSAYKPTLVYLDEQNHINQVKHSIPAQAA